MATKFPAPSWATETTHANLALEVRSGGTLLRRHELPRGRRVFVIGRQADVADVVVRDDETASRQHCAIVPRGERLYLIDLRSTRGTFVDGARLPPNEPTELSPGARLALSDAPPYSIELVGLPRAGLAAASSVPISMAAAAHVPSRFSGDPSYYNQKWDPDAAAARRDEALQLETNLRWSPPAWAVMGTGAGLAVNLVEGGEVVQALDLSQKKAYVLGRSREQADYVVPDESVSRQHAALMHGPPDPPRTGEAHEALLTPWRCRCGWENRPTNGVCGGGRRPYGCGVNRAVGCPDYRPATAAQTSLHVADLASTKGTFLDTGDGVWRRLQQQTPIRVPPGGRLRLGECETLVVRPAPPSQPAHHPTQSIVPMGAAALAAARAAAASRAADDKTSAYRKAMEAAAALVARPSRKHVSEAFSALPPPPPPPDEEQDEAAEVAAAEAAQPEPGWPVSEAKRQRAGPAEEGWVAWEQVE